VWIVWWEIVVSLKMIRSFDGCVRVVDFAVDSLALGGVGTFMKKFERREVIVVGKRMLKALRITEVSVP
jgi:hypothetical protein